MFIHNISDGINTTEISNSNINSKEIALKILGLSNEQYEYILSTQYSNQNEDNSNWISFPKISLDILNTSDNEDNMEYVLVREPKKKKRKWKNNNNNNNRNNKFQMSSHKGKPKYNLEDFKRRLLPSNQVTVSSPIKYSKTSGSTSKSSAKTSLSSNSSYCNDRSNNLYRNPIKSRYDFANDEDEKETGVDVPEFISDLIYMEMSSFTFYKKIGGFKDDLVMNEEVEKVIDWNNSVQKLVFWILDDDM